MDIIVPCVILLRIRHKDFAIEIPDSKRRITCWKIWVNEAIGIHLMKSFIVRFNLAGMKISRIQEVVTIGDAKGGAFVNGVVNTVIRAVVDGNDGVRLVKRGVPT